MAKRKTIEVPFESLVCDTDFNSREQYKGIAELAESIKASGLLQNIGVCENKDGPDGTYFVVYGFRRYLAIEKIRADLGPEAFANIEVVLNDGTREELRERNLKENIDREQLAPYEIALTIKKMVNAGLEQRDIASRLGRPQSWVSYHYKVATKLAPADWQAFRAGTLTLEQALHIADVDEDAQGEVVTKVTEADTRTEARQIAKDAAAAAGTRRKYTNKGRPTSKNLAQYVSDVSFDASASGLSRTGKSFANGLAAGIRVALGELSFKGLSDTETYTDTDYHLRNKRAKAAAALPEGAPKKRRGRPPKDPNAPPKEKAPTVAKAAKPKAPKAAKAAPAAGAAPKRRGRPPKNRDLLAEAMSS